MENIQKTVFVSTYGCQMNVNDSERMLSLLEMQNYSEVPTPEQADLIIINSCSVREKPVHKVRSEVGHYRKLKNLNPKLRIGVGGCVGQQEKSQLLKTLPVLDFVFGPDNIDALPGILTEIEEKKRSQNFAKFEHGQPYQIQTLVRNPKVSTFVNITKGCDNFCSFCVVPFTRGRLRSRAMSELVKDILALCDRGVKEVTLLGQNVNSYRSECGADFSDLLQELCQKTPLLRIRYTTSHPKDFDDKLIQTMADETQKLGTYIHLPVQSGNSEMLKSMNRGYSREEYLEKIAKLKNKIPQLALSTDLIVGFPGETDQQFEETMTLIEQVEYETLFAFKYSPRPFTKSLKLGDTVSEDVKSERLQRLQAAQMVITERVSDRYLNTKQEILIEDKARHSPDCVIGRTSTNRLVVVPGDQHLIGQLRSILISKTSPNHLEGKLL